MRFKQIIETTSAGSVATVAMPMMTQTRENTNVKGLKPVDQMKKVAKKKGPYSNSITEGKVKELSIDLTELTTAEFQKKYGKTKAEIKASMTKVNEDDLAEQDLIVIPGQGRLRKTGFVKHDLDQGEHEGHTLKNSLHTIARAASELDERLSVQSEFPEWVSEKIGAAKGMMVTVMDYLISSQEMQHDRDAVNEGEVSTSNLRTMYDLARMVKYHCSPEGQESLNELLKIIKWYMDQADQGVAEGSGGNWYIRVNGKILNDTKFKPVIFSSEDEARSHAMKLADKKRIPLSQIKLTKSWMDAPEQGVAEGLPQTLRKVVPGYAKREIDKKMDAEKFGRTDVDRDANFQRYKKIQDKIKDKGVAEDSLNELSSALLQRAAQTATDKRNQAMDPKLHDALSGGYMNPLAQHYDDVSQKINNRAGQVRKKETIQNIASKIASPAVMRKMGMSGVAEGSEIKIPTEDGITMQDIRLMAGEGKLTKKTVLQAIAVIRKQREKQGVAEAFDLDDLRKAAASSRSPEDERALKRNPDFGKLMQKSVNKHNKAVVKTKQAVGSRIADIGAGGKEYNVKTDAAWDAAKKSVEEGWKSKLGAAALAGAAALGGGSAQAQNAPSGYDKLPSIVAQITFQVDGKSVTKDINLGTEYQTPGHASQAVKDFMKSKGIKFYNFNLHRADAQPPLVSKDEMNASNQEYQRQHDSNNLSNTPYSAKGDEPARLQDRGYTSSSRPNASITYEGSAPKEKQKTPYRDINGPEYKAAADKQKEKMAKDKAAEPGKQLADKIANNKKA